MYYVGIPNDSSARMTWHMPDDVTVTCVVVRSAIERVKITFVKHALSSPCQETASLHTARVANMQLLTFVDPPLPFNPHKLVIIEEPNAQYS